MQTNHLDPFQSMEGTSTPETVYCIFCRMGQVTRWKHTSIILIVFGVDLINRDQKPTFRQVKKMSSSIRL